MAIYGYVMVWEEALHDENWNVAHTVEHRQYFLESEYEKAREIASRLSRCNETVELRYLTENFQEVFGYRVKLN